MNMGDAIVALELPSAARLDRRVPKKLLIENGTPTSADKRWINAGVEELVWVAALKPAAIGVPAYRDSEREYLEIAVLSLVLRETRTASRVVELVHRAIPYPVLLVAAHAATVVVSVAHKRQAQNEAGKVVLDESVVEAALPPDISPAILAMLRVAAQPKTNLLAFYQGWLECVEAIQAGEITGQIRRAHDATAADARRRALAQRAGIIRELRVLRSRTERETQIARRVDFNQAIQRLQNELTETEQRL